MFQLKPWPVNGLKESDAKVKCKEFKATLIAELAYCTVLDWTLLNLRVDGCVRRINVCTNSLANFTTNTTDSIVIVAVLLILKAYGTLEAGYAVWADVALACAAGSGSLSGCINGCSGHGTCVNGGYTQCFV